MYPWIVTYVGAGSLLVPSAAFDLGRGWAWQRKEDGVYGEARLDGAGRVASVVSRNGREVAEARELLGIVAGPPGSVLVGELDAHTEAGNATARAAGYRCLRLFDCLALGGEDVRGLSYLDRWGALHRAQSWAEGEGLARASTWEDDAATGRAHAVDGSGRFCRRVPMDLRRFPVVPLMRSAAEAREAWRSVEDGAAEGLVAVRLDAKAGARGSKRKVKITDTIDARVVEVGAGCARVATRAGSTQRAWRDRPSFTVAADGLRVGAVVEVAHHGYYASGEPRFARVVRARSDV